jgi:hypothetical protein
LAGLVVRIGGLQICMNLLWQKPIWEDNIYLNLSENVSFGVFTAVTMKYGVF